METTIEETNDFLCTPCIEKIQRSIERAVKRDEWICISGQVGSGKTYIKNYYLNRWFRESQRYIVIEQPSFAIPTSRMHIIMGRMLQAITPGEPIPRDIESRYIRLRTVLLRANRTKRKIILLIDEAQDTNSQTLRELKKIHELSGPNRQHLFSIVMFSKESEKMEIALEGEELGYRVRRCYLHDLSEEDIFFFAEHFGCRFGQGEEDQAAKNLFLQGIRPTPLSVLHFCGFVRELNDFNGIVRLAHIKKYRSKTLKERLTSRGIPQNLVGDRYVEIYQRQRPSKTTISRALNHELNTKTARDIRALASDMLADQFKERIAVQ